MAPYESVPAEYVSVPSEELLAYSQRHLPDGYVSASVFAHVHFNRGVNDAAVPRIGVALYVSYPRFVDDEPAFAYVCLACPYLARASAHLFKPGVCSPRTTWVKISFVHGCSPLVVPFADSVKLSQHCIRPEAIYHSATRSAVCSLERIALQDPDFGVFAD